MRRMKVKGNRRLTARARGQSLPLIAMMIVVLVGMVGLSVDVGNTFQTERRAVAASNAASIAGMNVYIRRNDSTTTQSVYNAILATLNSNGVQVAAPGDEPGRGELAMSAVYLDSQGRPLSPPITDRNNWGNTVPNNVGFVQVTLSGRVDTYFARVVGRNDLPLGATAYAGTCPDGEGVFPIGIDQNILDGAKFKNPGDRNPADGVPDNGWRTITEGKYAGYTAMRMNVQDGQQSGGFSWLRWAQGTGATGSNSNSARELEASLTLPGNATAVFEEADWPNGPTPEDYPLKPGIINAGDWISGSTGYVSKVDDLMDMHVREGTRMRLPIYNGAFGNGSNAVYRVADFGVFVVLSHGIDRSTNPPVKYIEFVYLGNNIRQESACSYTPPTEAEPTYTLRGEVSIRPEYAQAAGEQKPIQYVVVLDVSGSMSANFDGKCDVGPGNPPSGRNYWQCTNGPASAIAPEVSNTGSQYYWNNVEERRITVAKRALESLVRSTNMPGNPGYTTTRPDDQMAIVWFTDNVDRDGTGNITSFGGSNFSSVVGTAPSSATATDGSGLLKAVYTAGRKSSNNFRTEGGTNGAAGLYRAALAFERADKTVLDPNGKTWQYKRVVVYITDGVSNNFLDKNDTDLSYGASTSSTYPSGHVCRTYSNVLDVATCQITGTEGGSGGGLSVRSGNIPAGLERPISQAGLVSKQDLQPKGVSVYAVALSNIPDVGLKDSIASNPDYFFSAASLQVSGGQTNVETIMKAINTKVETGLCTPRSDVLDGGNEWRVDIPGNQFVPVGGLQYPTVGEVTLKNVADDQTYTAPIIATPDQKLKYEKDLPAGTYLMTAYVFYRHPLDPAGTLPRMYGNIFENERSNDGINVDVGASTAVGGGLSKVVEKDVKLVLTGNVCAGS